MPKYNVQIAHNLFLHQCANCQNMLLKSLRKKYLIMARYNKKELPIIWLISAQKTKSLRVRKYQVGAACLPLALGAATLSLALRPCSKELTLGAGWEALPPQVVGCLILSWL